jgi:hypothetical protein
MRVKAVSDVLTMLLIKGLNGTILGAIYPGIKLKQKQMD